jgi:hypothetical protein
MPDEEPRPSNWHRATRDQVALIETVLQLVQEFYMLNGSWPTKAWLLQQVGLSP